MNKIEKEFLDWWSTSIIKMSPNKISYRGNKIENLIKQNFSLSQMIFLLTLGKKVSKDKAQLLDLTLMASVDHGPQSPAIAVSRMAMTCGIGINNAMASAANVLGDVHGGAGQQSLEMYNELLNSKQSVKAFSNHQIKNKKNIPGFGHRFHKIDPRVKPLKNALKKLIKKKQIKGKILKTAEQIETELKKIKKKSIPMNIDGISAVIYGELGFPPILARGLFVISRSIGIMAHAYEQSLRNEKNKGPIPKKYTWTYKK